MAKGSGRFRNRKLGFKTRINVEIGVVIEEDPLDEHLDVEDEKGRKGPETGVDKDEEGEVHLQAVIASTAAYVASSSSSTSALDPKGKKKASSQAGHVYIPTRSCVQIPDEEYRALYKSGYVDPFSYIRFSDTVEDCIKGAVAYTMDEDDEDWLEDFNAQFSGENDKAKASSTADEETGGRGARVKGKAADEPSASSSSASDLPGPLSEDDFELIMEVFELVTDAKAPMAHVNLDLLPDLPGFEYAFHDELKPHLAKLWPYAKDVHPHWRERRVARKGRWIIPQLDYDESNENNPYVCFRRRELKTSRKTRRSDQQNLERLIRLRNDLYAAHALMEKVSERERLKLDAIQLERKVFEERCEVKELKRRLNEPDGDEELLISRREKKRKRDDPLNGSLRLSLRKPDPSNLSPAALVPPLEELQARKQRNDLLVKQIERDLAKKRQGDQHWDDWTDASYLARPPPTPARFWRSIEPVPHTVPFNGPKGKREALGFATSYQPPLGMVRPSFRKRVGRGGRILLDRISMGGKDGDDLPGRRRRLLPLDEEEERSDVDADADDQEEEDEWLAHRRSERFKYDTDVGLDFPLADEPILIDDFELPYLLRRIGLLKQADVENLQVDSSYLDEAFRFVSQDPDKNQPAPIVVGRPPQRPPLQMAPSQAAAAASAGTPAMGGPGGGMGAGVAGQQQQQQPNAAAFAQAQQQLAAQQQLRMAQQQAAMRKQQQAMAAAAAAGQAGAGGEMRRTPSSQQGSPVAGAAQAPGVGQMQMGMPNGHLSPAGQYHPSGFTSQGSPLSANGLALHPPPPNQQQQGQPRPNGLPAGSSPQSQHLLNVNGANGLPATSRLSAPPFSNNAALQMALQAQQQQQLAAAIAANGGSPISLQQLQQVQAAQAQAQAQAHAAAQGRPMSANGVPAPPGVLPPSRPASAASAHPSAASHSPHMGQPLGLPSMSPTTAANHLRANGAAGTPPPNAQMVGKRSSPMASVGVNGLGPAQYAALQAQAQAQGLQLQKGQYGGFVQG
ncbi:hypothetical protein JCM11251_005250 [Rhodosporidiobolus azoricus]